MKREGPDYAKWKRRRLWSLEEGLQLLFGVEPLPHVLAKLHSGSAPYTPRALRTQHAFGTGSERELHRRLNIAMQSVAAGVLNPDSERCGAPWANELTPENFLRWAKTKGWEIPEELKPLLGRVGLAEADQDVDSEPENFGKEPLGSFERRLLFIKAVIRSLGYDPRKIPTGGKRKIRAACLDESGLFTPSTFDDAWKKARKLEVVKMAEHNKFVNR